MPWDDLIRDKRAEAVKRLPARMPPKLRGEAGMVLGMPIRTVRSRLHTGVMCLAKYWKTIAVWEVADWDKGLWTERAAG
jgi:hypothetical protein